ncbi:hypothetical protein E8E15_001112 [Penicillium rubens]|nr:hypothetical protein E8E15_001112 [Penicillium rubens]
MRIIQERTCAILHDIKLPDYLWPEIMKMVMMVRNLTIYHGRKQQATSDQNQPTKTPYEIRYGRKPDISFLRILGCNAYVVRNPEEIRVAKFTSRHLQPRA